MIPLSDTFFFFGVVEDIHDPEQQGRLRVRIFGAHTEDKSQLPTDALPWCKIGLPANNASISGKGRSPNGARQGTRVAGIFLDGAAKQMPLVLFTLPGRAAVNKNSDFGFNDPDGVYPLSGRSTDISPLVGGSIGQVSSEFYQNRVTNSAVAPAQADTPDVLAPPADPTIITDAKWMPFAIGEIGVNEEKNAARVREYHKTGGGLNVSEDVAWCASFVGWCLKQAGLEGTRSAMARSYSSYGKDAGTPIPYGSIVVMAGTRGPSSGHVVFFTKDMGEKFECVGGNQTVGDGKKFDTGGQVTRGVFSKSKIVAVRYPT